MKTILIVDGYNVIHLKAELEGKKIKNLEKEREELIEQLNSYAGYKEFETILVFDAWKQAEKQVHEETRGRIQVVYTEKDQTADSYIEKRVFEMPRLYRVIVVTSDYSIQRQVLANGGERMSSRELIEDLLRQSIIQPKKSQDKAQSDQNKIVDYLDEAALEKMKTLRKGE